MAVKKEETKKKVETKPQKVKAKKVATKQVVAKKEVATKQVVEQKKVTAKKKTDKYFEGIGRRKTAVARVRLFFKEKQEILINEKNVKDYFPLRELQQIVYAPLELTETLEGTRVSAKVNGGGINAQAEAVRHGIARALVLFNPEFRRKLKGAGYLKRDPRMRERKKFGLKRARRAPQWKKR